LTNTVYLNGNTLTFAQGGTATFESDVYGNGTLEADHLIFKGHVSSSPTLIADNIDFVGTGDTQTISSSSSPLTGHVVFGGAGAKNIYNNITINASMTVARTLTVNGEIINQGTIQNSRYYLYLHTSGNLTNNGTWTNQQLTLTNPEQVVIKGSEPIAATKVIIEAENLEMVQPNLQSQVEFKKANVTLTGQATTTFGGNVTAGTITTQGISVILLTGQSISTSIQGDSLQKIVFSKDNQNISGTFNATNEIIFSGSEQNFSGTFNATQVTMDGTGKKYLVYDTTINGSMTIAEGVTLQSHLDSQRRDYQSGYDTK